MAKRITEYTNIETIAESDVLPIVDVSDTEQATTGSTRKGTVGKIADYIKDRAETLTNKILTTARLNTPKINEDVTVTATSTELNKLDGMAGDAVGTTDTQTLTNKTIKVSDNTLSGMLDWFYPIGTIYETTSTDLDTTTKMNAHFGGTWEAYGSGRVLVGKASSGTFATAGATMGAETVDLQHKHLQSIGADGVNLYMRCTNPFGSTVLSADRTFTTQTNRTTGPGRFDYTDNGGSTTQSIVQPSIVVYRYRRTA